MRNASDEQLMTRYAAGEMKAFEELYQRYKGPLYRYLQRQLQEPATVNDLYQGCWEKLINGRNQFRSGVPFRAWLFRIAHNHLVDYFRAQRPEVPMPVYELVSSQPTPDDFTDQDAHSIRFDAALRDLPEVQRNTLMLRFETGLGLEEIGKITGVERETVKSRLRYATSKLKKGLKP